DAGRSPDPAVIFWRSAKPVVLAGAAGHGVDSGRGRHCFGSDRGFQRSHNPPDFLVVRFVACRGTSPGTQPLHLLAGCSSLDRAAYQIIYPDHFGLLLRVDAVGTGWATCRVGLTSSSSASDSPADCSAYLKGANAVL